VLAGASVNTIAELSSIRPTTRSGHSAPATKDHHRILRRCVGVAQPLTRGVRRQCHRQPSTEIDDNQCADHATVHAAKQGHSVVYRHVHCEPSVTRDGRELPQTASTPIGEQQDASPVFDSPLTGRPTANRSAVVWAAAILGGGPVTGLGFYRLVRSTIGRRLETLSRTDIDERNPPPASHCLTSLVKTPEASRIDLASIHRRALIARWLLIDLDQSGCGRAGTAGLPSFSCWSVFGPFGGGQAATQCGGGWRSMVLRHNASHASAQGQ